MANEGRLPLPRGSLLTWVPAHQPGRQPFCGSCQWRQALGGFRVLESARQGERADAPPGRHAGALGQALAIIGSLDPAAPKAHAAPEPALFNRAQLTQEEIHILRAVSPSPCSRRLKPLNCKAFSLHPLPLMLARLRSNIQCILDRDPAR